MLKQRNGLAFVAALLWAALVWAGEGHNHGAESPGPHSSDPAQPRFYATSESFELVGVVDGKRLALYLDHAADNSPVKEATLELEIGGAKVAVTPHGEGEFEARLSQPLAPGVIPITATMVAKGESDLLAGELDLHEAAQTDPGLPSRWGWIIGSASAVLAAALTVAWFLRRKRGLPIRKPGGAA